MVAFLKHYAAGPSGPDAMSRARVALDHGSVGVGICLEATFTYPDVQVGDAAFASLASTSTLTAGLAYAGARVVAANVIGISLANITTAAIDPAAMSWDVVAVK